MIFDLRGPVARYALSVAVTLISLALTKFLWDVLTSGFPFLLLFLAIAISSWYGGFGCGLVSACLSAVGAAYFLFGSGEIFRETEIRNLIALVLFFFIAVLISTFGTRTRRVKSEYLVTLASIGDAVISTDAEGKIHFINPVAEALTGWSQKEAHGRQLSEIFRVQDELTGERMEDPFQKVRKSGFTSSITNHTVLITRSGAHVPIESSGSPIRNDEGKIVGIVLVFRDVTDRRAAETRLRESVEELKRSEQIILGQLKEKEVLLAEVHHRVKNNLQIMLSLLNMQARRASPELRELVSESENRIRAMALIHEKLYASDNFSEIDLSGYLSQLLSRLVINYAPGREIQTEMDSDNNIRLSLQKALACGLIANELITNSLKHAFPEDKGTGKISIRCTSEDHHISLEIADTGKGMPDGIDPENTKSLGLRLVSLLVKQLDGKMQINSSAQGTSYRIVFPED